MSSAEPSRFSLGACASLACLWEATSAKPGNVHRGADFEDLSYADFLASAAVIGPVIERCSEQGLGATVLAGVEATQRVAGVNTNLGTLLLLAPLAMAKGDTQLAGKLIEQATADDVADIYQAIRLAKPGGLGEVEQGDVAQPPEHSLLAAMQLAADRDLIARQYTTNFADVVAAADYIESHLAGGRKLNDSIVLGQLLLLSRHGDSLVARKLGQQLSDDLATQAATTLALYTQDIEAYYRGVADLDFWLRADGHRRNPGTTADLLAAALFVLLVQNRLSMPVQFYAPPVE
ncbi:triphosphoribosyl-dephospho-CoA synthase [Aeoliella mucimassa]|uniref:ATP:dephospho-CoA triphosphoribosyl transferase n=1 Tax=Aeoliella mucimassa TaxID=2527972 RepID=A0A518ATW5_9BACT|nr:triphosphoribosyl-dephospho-CoA synthase [Aeoliella mucimassa]QDU58157.1 ATP:dephospho-CoA triphosphoribosyl transferase [Aeoliella mucimassa]